MSSQQYTNQAVSTLGLPYTSGASSLTLSSGTGSAFPATGNFTIGINDPPSFDLLCPFCGSHGIDRVWRHPPRCPDRQLGRRPRVERLLEVDRAKTCCILCSWPHPRRVLNLAWFAGAVSEAGLSFHAATSGTNPSSSRRRARPTIPSAGSSGGSGTPGSACMSSANSVTPGLSLLINAVGRDVLSLIGLVTVMLLQDPLWRCSDSRWRRRRCWCCASW